MCACVCARVLMRKTRCVCVCVILLIANSGNYLHLSTVIHYKQFKFICTLLFTMQIIAKQL